MFGIPAKTFDLVLALAKAYGHLWAFYAEEEGAPSSLDEFERYVHVRSDVDGAHDPEGIYAPTVIYEKSGVFDYVTHTTGSGRLEWTVWSNVTGKPVVWAAIHRPNEEKVIVVHPYGGEYLLTHASGGIGSRHVQAMRDFVFVAAPHVEGLESVSKKLEESIRR